MGQDEKPTGYHTDWTPLDAVIIQWQAMADRVANAKARLEEADQFVGDNFGWSATTLAAFEYDQNRKATADGLGRLHDIYVEDVKVLGALNRRYAAQADFSREQYDRLMRSTEGNDIKTVGGEIDNERAAEEAAARKAEDDELRASKRQPHR